MELETPSFVRSAASRPRQEKMDEDDEKSNTGEEEEIRSKGPKSKSPRRLPAAVEEKPGKGAARGSGSGRRAGTAEEGYEAELATATARLALKTQAGLADTKGYLEMTALIPETAGIVVNSLAEGVAFNKEKEEKKGQNIGAAHGRIAVAGFLGLSKMPEVKGTELEKAIQEFWTHVVSKGIKEVESQVQVFKMQKPKIPSSRRMSFGEVLYARMTYRMAPATQQSQVAANLEYHMTQFFKHMNWEVLTGTAPRMQEEREVHSLLNKARRPKR